MRFVGKKVSEGGIVSMGGGSMNSGRPIRISHATFHPTRWQRIKKRFVKLFSRLKRKRWRHAL